MGNLGDKNFLGTERTNRGSKRTKKTAALASGAKVTCFLALAPK